MEGETVAVVRARALALAADHLGRPLGPLEAALVVAGVDRYFTERAPMPPVGAH